MLEYLDAVEKAAPSHGNISTLGDLVAVVFNVFLGLGLGISLIGIILAGIKYLSARSDIKATISAKVSLTHSVVGLLLVLGAYTIYRIIVATLGASL